MSSADDKPGADSAASPPAQANAGKAASAPAAATTPPVDPAAAAEALAQFEASLGEESTTATKTESPASAEPKQQIAAATAKAAKPATTAAKQDKANAPAQVSASEPQRKPSPTKPAVVSFRNVTKTFGEGKSAFTAIRDVSFDIPDYPGRGEFVSILGPSGCGKSTVIRLIAGLTPQFPQTSGEVLIDGKTVSGPGKDRGMVFQDYTSFDHMSVLDNVAFGLRCGGMDSTQTKDQALHWINKVGLSIKSDANKYPHQLSGGMRQRVAIARTLILEPRIILMDEPFGALDPPTRSRMQDQLVSLWREQSPTIFFITHSIEEAVFLGDTILIFSPSPGTVLKTVKVPPPDRPSSEMHRDPGFRDTVFGIRDVIEKLESSQRAGD